MEVDKQANTKDHGSDNTDQKDELAGRKTGPKGELSSRNTDPKEEIPGTNTNPKGELPVANIDPKGKLPGTGTDPKGDLSGMNTDPKCDLPGTNTDPKGDLPGTNTDPKVDHPGKNTDQKGEPCGTKFPAILHGDMDKQYNNSSNVNNSRNIHFDDEADNLKDKRGNNKTKSNVEHEPEDIINTIVYRDVEVNGLKIMNDVALTDIDRVHGDTGVTKSVDLHLSSGRDFDNGNDQKENPLEDLIKVTEIENVYVRQEIKVGLNKSIDTVKVNNVIQITDDLTGMKQRNVHLSLIKEEELETDVEEEKLQQRESVPKLEEKLRKEERKFVKLAENVKLRQQEEERIKLEEKLKREEEEIKLEGEKLKRREEELAKLGEELKREEKELAKLEEEKLKREEELARLEEEERFAREEGEKLAKQIVEKEMRKLREENLGQIQRHNQEVDEFARKIAEEQLALLMKEEEIERKNKEIIQKAHQEKKEAGKRVRKQPIKIPLRGGRGSTGAGSKIPGDGDEGPTVARSKIMLKLGVR